MSRRLRTMIADDRGLTLAEILIALVIIGVGLVGLAVVIPVSSYGMQEGGQLSTATFLAEQMVERARAVSWTATPEPNGTDCLGVSDSDAAPVPLAPATCGGVAATQFPDETPVTGYPTYGRRVRVTNCAVTPCAGVADAGMRLVTVTVTYRGLTASGVSPTDKTVMLQWLVARK